MNELERQLRRTVAAMVQSIDGERSAADVAQLVEAAGALSSATNGLLDRLVNELAGEYGQQALAVAEARRAATAASALTNQLDVVRHELGTT